MSKYPLLAALFLLVCTAEAAPAAPADPSAARKQMEDAVMREDTAAAMAAYADGALIDGTPSCFDAPCKGKEGVRKEINARIAVKNRYTMLNDYVSGNVLTRHYEVRNTGTQKAGVDRVVAWVIDEVKDGKIVTEHVMFDRADAQTVKFLEWLTLQY